MPHNWATSGKHVDEQFTGLHLIGNVRAATNSISRADLYVDGDAIFNNDIKVLSNIITNSYITGNLIGNVTGDITSNNYSTFNGTLDLTSATILGFAGTGEVNSGVNLGDGTSSANVFAQKSGLNLQFRSIKSGTNTLISQNASFITYGTTANITGNLLGNVYGNLYGDVRGNIKADIITENTTNSGVTVEGVLIKDGSVIVSDTFTGDLLGGNITGNLYGNLYGNVIGNVVTDLIISKTGSGINIEDVTINNGLVTGNLNGDIVGFLKFRVLNPVGVGSSGEDVAPLLTYATEQKTKGLPIFLHDPDNDEFQLQGISGTGTNYNDLEWYGIESPILRLSNVTLVTNGITNCNIRVMGNTFVTISGGASEPINKLFDIPNILNDPTITATGTPASRGITFNRGYFRVGEIKATNLVFDAFLTNNARVDLSKLTKVNRISIGTGCRLNVNDVTRDTTDTEIYVGEQSTASTTDSYLEIDEINSSAIDISIRGTRSVAKVNNIKTSSSITVESTSNESTIIGQDNDITIIAGATNTNIFGIQNSITDSGTNSEYILRPATISGISFTLFSADGEGSIKLRRDGNMVTIHIDDITGTSNGVTFSSPTGTIPAAYRPTGFDVVKCCVVTDAGLDVLGSVLFRTDGEIEFYAGVPGAAFTASGTKGSYALSASWII